MIRTLIFGAIAGYVGKKLYDEGKLTDFKDDLVSRYHQVKDDMSSRSNSTSDSLSPTITPTPPRPTASSSPIIS
ncbi:MAG TPA: hypothetical protein VJM09_09865 [Sphingobium sp.]|nr:hypothetical protein [Sphingobium sp.]